jgi:hypothetical protein
MNCARTFRARFRFRVQKKLNIKEHEHRFKVGGRDVVLSPPLPDIPISESEWLVMNARGFDLENAASTFAEKLKAASEISSVATRLGIDSGINLATAGLGQAVRTHIQEQTGLEIRDNVHGVDVFPDDPNVRILNITATGSVLAEPDPFLSDLNRLLHVADGTSKKTRETVLLLNYALMRPEPIAQIVFAFSAVEMLGQQEEWSSAQKCLLDKLATDAENAAIGTVDERREVSAAIKRSTQKLGLRQGVLRLLTSLDLSHLKKKWDELYGQRSTLVHGLAPQPGADYSQLATETVSLCGQVLLKVIANEVPGANAHVARFYKT